MNPMLIPAILSGATGLFGYFSNPGNQGMNAARQIPGLANLFYDQMWKQMGSGLTRNAMSAGAASQGALRSSMAGTGLMGTGLGKTQLALGKGAFFNNLSNQKLGLYNSAWERAASMFPGIYQGGMGSDMLRYGLMGAGIEGLGNAALNWGKYTGGKAK